MPVGGWKVSFIPYYMKSKMEWGAPQTDDAIRVLSSEKYDGIEWMLGYHFNSIPQLKSLAEKTRKAGVDVSNIMCWQDLVTSDDNVRTGRTKVLQNYIEAAGNLGIPIFNVFTGPMTWNPSHEKIGRDISEGKAWSTVKDAFSEIIETAEENQVVVTLEAVFGMLVHDYYSMREFLSYFESKNMGVNLDPSHLILYGNDPSWAVSRFGQRIRHVHVKDAAGKFGVLGEDFVFPFLGEGLVDWNAFFGALRDVGYSGYLSLEFENDAYLSNVCHGDWTLAAREAKLRLSSLLQTK